MPTRSPAAVVIQARPSVLRFDNLTATDDGRTRIPNGYGRLEWDAFQLAIPAAIAPQYGITGYSTGLISGDQVAFVSAGSGSTTAKGTIASGSAADFSLVSAYLTSAWRDGETVTVIGFDDGLSDTGDRSWSAMKRQHSPG